MPQGPPAFAQPQRTSAGNAQIALQKTVLPRAKPAQPGGPVNPQQFPLGPERLGPNSQQLSMPKGYPFATSSGAGPNFGTGGLGSSSGRPIASQSFGALNQQQQKAMPQGVNLSLGGGQSGASATNQLSRLVDLSAANQQRPVGPSGGNFMQRGGGLGPMPQGQAPPQKGGETFARQQAKNSKGSGPANFAKPSPQSGGALFNQQRMPSPAHPLPQNMVAPQQQQHMGGVAMPGGEDKNWQYRNHGNPAAEAKKKADDETKKRAEKERRQARQRTKEQQGEFELQYLAEQQQQHDAHKKQAAAAAQQASEQYAAFAQAKKFAPGGLLFGQQQQAKAQAAGGLARQQGGGKGQMQARGGPPPANMHPPGEMGAGLTLGRSVNPSTGGVSRNGTPGPARSHDVPPHMQVARPISRGASGSKVPANGGVPFQPKQAPGGPPVSRQSPPMPVQAVPERRSLESSGAQSRDAAALQGNQLMEQQQAKPDALRQGYKPTTESNGLRPTADIALLTRPPLVVSASSPSKAAAPMPALAQASIPRNFESQLGSLPLAARLPIRDASEQVVASMQAPIGGLQVPISLGRDAVHSPTKDTAVQKVLSPRTLQSIQESAILPIAEADKVVSGS